MTSPAIYYYWKNVQNFKPIFEQNADGSFEAIFEQNQNFESIFKRNVNFEPIFEQNVNFEDCVKVSLLRGIISTI